jgi:assimilatory nitrate reductase catalytic subunit
MYLPFGKLFHIFQRPGNLGVAYYKQQNAEGPGGVPAVRRRLRQRPADRRPQGRASEVGFDYTIDGSNADGTTTRTRAHVAGGPRSRWRRRLGSEDSADGPHTDHRRRAHRPYGPHLNQAPPGGWDAGLEIDKVVETHCCFCGQQCGIKLKVHDNEVVGFEPWYDFPFNEGKLCPKGVKRYLQGSHPDRLLRPMERDETARRVPQGHLGRSARSSVSARSSASRPPTATTPSPCCPGCRSRTRRATSSASSPAWRCTANLDYNGRYCMVSAGAGNKKALGVDRAEPVERHPARRRGVGGRVERRRDVPDHHQLHLAGATAGQAHRPGPPRVPTGPHRGPVPAGPARDRFGAVRRVLHELIRHDWLDHEFIDDHTVDFDLAAAESPD